MLPQRAHPPGGPRASYITPPERALLEPGVLPPQRAHPPGGPRASYITPPERPLLGAPEARGVAVMAMATAQPRAAGAPVVVATAEPRAAGVVATPMAVATAVPTPTPTPTLAVVATPSPAVAAATLPGSAGAAGPGAPQAAVNGAKAEGNARSPPAPIPVVVDSSQCTVSG